MQTDELVQLIKLWQSKICKTDKPIQLPSQCPSSTTKILNKKICDYKKTYGINPVKQPLLMIPVAKRNYECNNTYAENLEKDNSYKVNNIHIKKDITKDELNEDKGYMEMNNKYFKEEIDKDFSEHEKQSEIWKKRILTAFVNQPLLQNFLNDNNKVKMKNKLSKTKSFDHLKIFEKTKDPNNVITEERILDPSVSHESVNDNEENLELYDNQEIDSQLYDKSYRNLIIQHILQNDQHQNRRTYDERGDKINKQLNCDLLDKRNSINANTLEIEIEGKNMSDYNCPTQYIKNYNKATIDIDSLYEHHIIISDQNKNISSIIDSAEGYGYVDISITNDNIYVLRTVESMSSSGNSENYITLDQAFKENSVKTYKLLSKKLKELNEGYEKAYKTYVETLRIIND